MKRKYLYNVVGMLSSRQLVQAPIFIVGTGRCGTTLLYRILKSHPQIAIYPSEANDLWHPLAYPFNTAKIELPSMENDPAEFTRRSIAAWPTGHDQLVRRTFAGFHRLAGTNKQFLLQSAMICYMMPKITELWPDARFVHLVRNGEAVVRSLTKKNWNSKFADQMSEEDYQLAAARYWRDCVTEVDRAAKALELGNDRFHQIRYEEMCDNPTETIARLADFADVPRDGFAFDYAQIRNTKDQSQHTTDDPTRQPIHDILADVATDSTCVNAH